MLLVHFHLFMAKKRLIRVLDCDSALQIPSQAAPVTECNIVFSGNANETCGGANRLNIFNNSGKPPPVIVQSVNTTTGMWHYQGCFTCVLSPIYSFKPLLTTRHRDSTAARTLRAGVNIPGGTTAESCTAACAAAGGFMNAGLENGHECCMSRSHRIYLLNQFIQIYKGVITQSITQHNVRPTMTAVWYVNPHTPSFVETRTASQYTISVTRERHWDPHYA